VTTACNGGVVLDWSMYSGESFNHYVTLRSTSSSIPAAYPPAAGVTALDGTYATWPEKVSGFDVSGTPGVTYHYRTVAFNAENQPLAASSVTGATAKPLKDLGGLGAAAESATDTRLTWTPYGGPAGCFTYYKLVYSETNPEPSYGTDPYLAALGSQEQSTSVTSDLASGHDYYLRVQAVRATHLGWFIAAQTDVRTYAVP